METSGHRFRAGPSTMGAAQPFLTPLPASRRKSGSNTPISMEKREPEPPPPQAKRYTAMLCKGWCIGLTSDISGTAFVP